MPRAWMRRACRECDWLPARGRGLVQSPPGHAGARPDPLRAGFQQLRDLGPRGLLVVSGASVRDGQGRCPRDPSDSTSDPDRRGRRAQCVARGGEARVDSIRPNRRIGVEQLESVARGPSPWAHSRWRCRVRAQGDHRARRAQAELSLAKSNADVSNRVTAVAPPEPTSWRTRRPRRAGSHGARPA